MEQNKKYGLYIITHKPVEQKFPIGRKVMLVGAYNKQVPNGYVSDFSSELPNISEKNANYCELTGFYYMVQNDNSDILGLEHYRRLFVKHPYYFFRYPFLKQKDIEKIMNKYDLIMPHKKNIKVSLMSSYAGNHYGSDMLEVRKIIGEKFPEYLKTFDDTMANHYSYYYNMFIGKREIVKRYADWLFEILFELEKRIDISDRTDHQKRVYGFLSELLFTVWINYQQNLKICEKYVATLVDKPIISQLKRIKRVIFKK